MPLGKEVGLGLGHTVLDGDPVGNQPPTLAPPHFRSIPIVAKRSPISATAELLFEKGQGMFFDHHFFNIMNFIDLSLLWSYGGLKSQDVEKKIIFLWFCGKITPLRKFPKFCSEKIHCDTGRRVVFKFREI